MALQGGRFIHVFWADDFYEKWSKEITPLFEERPFFLDDIPEPGEYRPFRDRFVFNTEPYDDGGGATLAQIRFGRVR